MEERGERAYVINDEDQNTLCQNVEIFLSFPCIYFLIGWIPACSSVLIMHQMKIKKRFGPCYWSIWNTAVCICRSQTNKDPLYSTWNSAQCYVVGWMGGEFRGKGYMYIPFGYFPLLYTLNSHNIVNQVYSDIKQKVSFFFFLSERDLGPLNREQQQRRGSTKGKPKSGHPTYVTGNVLPNATHGRC